MCLRHLISKCLTLDNLDKTLEATKVLDKISSQIVRIGGNQG